MASLQKSNTGFAYQVTNQLLKEIKEKKNAFINRGLKDYLKERKNKQIKINVI